MKTLIVGILITFMGIVWVVGSSRYFEQCVTNEQNEYEHNKQSLKENSASVITIVSYRHCIGEFSVHYKDVITALATFLLVFVTLGLVWTGYSQIITTRVQLRAYIFAEKIEILNFGVNKCPKVRILVRNFGQTPAKNFKQWCTMGFDVYPPSLNNPFQDIGALHSHPLAPNAFMYMDSHYRVLDAKEVAGIEKGEVALYVIGEIFYEDAFGRRRVTKYKFFANGMTGISNGTAAATKEGNDYT